MEDLWSNGSIVSYNPQEGTGLIRTFDGEEVIFYKDEVRGSTVFIAGAAEPVPTVGQTVVFRIEKTEYGLLAREITMLSLKHSKNRYK